MRQPDLRRGGGFCKDLGEIVVDDLGGGTLLAEEEDVAGLEITVGYALVMKRLESENELKSKTVKAGCISFLLG